MKKRYFKDNKSYFNYLHKYKENINVIRVKPMMKKNSQSQVCLYYERREPAV